MKNLIKRFRVIKKNAAPNRKLTTIYLLLVVARFHLAQASLKHTVWQRMTLNF